MRSPTISAISCALETPESIKDWSLTNLNDKLIKIGDECRSCGAVLDFDDPRDLFSHCCLG